MDRLIRETQPPAGSYPSPVPQYWNPATGQYERVYGAAGANRVQLYAHDGTTLLPVKVDSEGRLVLAQEVSVGDVTVNVGPLGEVTLSGSKVLPAQTLFQNQPMTIHTQSPWIPCSGYNRAIVLIQIDGNPGNTSIAIRGRADTDVAVLAMYLLNTGVAMTKTAVPGYYELDVNPMSELQAYIYGSVSSTATVTVKAWLSATTFIPDSPGAAIPLFNAVAIRDQSGRRAPVISGYGIGEARLIVDNSLDADVVFVVNHPYGNIPAYKMFDSDGTPALITVPSGAERLVITPAEWPLLGGMLPEEFRFGAEAQSVPTTGSLTATLLAKPSA